MKRFLIGVLSAAVCAVAVHGAVFDAIRLGDSASEDGHLFEAGSTTTAAGLLVQSCRITMPREIADWRGDGMTFQLRVHPERQNYITLQFSGDEINENMLILLVNGKQLGYRFYGDIEIPAPANQTPIAPGRFYYVTLPLPMSATYRKERVELELFSAGPVWMPGRSFTQFQTNMTTPGRGVYRVTTHDGPWYVPDPEDVRGKALKPQRNYLTVADRAKVPNTVLATEPVLSDQTQLLAFVQEYSVDKIGDKMTPFVVSALDALSRRFQLDPGLASNDRTAVEPELTGFGPAGQAFLLMGDHLTPFLDQNIPGMGTRRKVWAETLEAGVRHLSANRRPWTKQSMIVDLNLFWCNWALRKLDPGKGLPPEVTLKLLRESVGAEPWSGSLNAKGHSTLPVEVRFSLFTAKGLPKEYGYEGRLGEDALELAGEILAAVRRFKKEPDKPILEAVERMVAARKVFLYDENNQLETSIGWRDTEVAGRFAMSQKSDWFLSFFERDKNGEPGNSVWSDEEVGVVAIRDGEEILFASLYWRAPSGINFLAKVHHMTPELERFAVVREQVDYNASGEVFLRPDRPNFGIAPGGLKDPDRISSLHAGETLPITMIPKEFNFKPGQEHPLAGRGEFYRLNYGPYRIGMNMGQGKEFSMTVPQTGRYQRFPEGNELSAGEKISVEAGRTVVLKQISEQ